MITHFLIFPLFVWGAIAAVGAFTVAGLAGAFDTKEVAKNIAKNPNVKRIAILGMQTAGKTRFLSFLKGEPFVEGTTSRKSYTEFVYRLTSGKNITISSGKDIGGGNIYRVDYNEMIENNDVIIFMFNMNAYIKNIIDLEGFPYQRSCNSRFEHVYDKIKESKKRLVVIATHKDECSLSESSIIQKFDILINSKTYKEMFKDVQLVDLTNNNDVEQLIDTIFKG